MLAAAERPAAQRRTNPGHGGVGVRVQESVMHPPADINAPVNCGNIIVAMLSPLINAAFFVLFRTSDVFHVCRTEAVRRAGCRTGKGPIAMRQDTFVGGASATAASVVNSRNVNVSWR
jgi:hypothetical protein